MEVGTSIILIWRYYLLLTFWQTCAIMIVMMATEFYTPDDRKYYLIVDNTESTDVETYANKDDLLKRINQLKVGDNSWGETIRYVIYGKELELKSKQVHTQWYVEETEE